jgi:tetratricopeptide (TPR) repeat protein
VKPKAPASPDGWNGGGLVSIGLMGTSEQRLRAVRTLIARGNRLKGIHLLSRILWEQPIHVPALLLRGELLYSNRRFRSARSDFLVALREQPENERACVFLGLIAGIYGRPDESRIYFERALSRVPDDLSVRWLLADSCFQRGEFGTALAHLHRILRDRPQDQQSLVDVGYCHFHRGELDEALGWFQRVLEFEPHHRIALHEAAKIWILEGMVDHARLYLRRILKQEPAAVGALTTMGYLQYYVGDVDTARASIAAALERDATYLPALLLLGGIELAERGEAADLARALKSLTARDLQSLPFVNTSHRTYSRQIWLPLHRPVRYRASA